jgi:transcriptional regulator with XRE-family HTH domain
LTQADVAYLLGAQSSGKVSRYERFARRPALETAVAFEIIFAVPVGNLFAGLREDIEREVKKRARRLRRRLLQQQAHRRTLNAVSKILDRSNEEPTYEPLP